jgi:hypothetical protein
LKKIRSLALRVIKKTWFLKGRVIIYRLNISRIYTVFYEIDTLEKFVIVHEILPNEQAQKKYGY